jgi:predicted  nucleic acid-binding Zn-ribbon protein
LGCFTLKRELAEANRRACEYYLTDESVMVMDSPEAVREARKKAVKRMIDMERELARALKLAEDNGKLAHQTACELAEARKQRDTLAEALDLSLSILIALMDGNEDVYDLIVTTTNKNTGEENKMSVREALEKSIAALAAVKGGEA